MKKLIIIFCLIGIGYWFSSSLELFSQLMNFLVVGAVPGSSHTISPTTMLLIFGFLSIAAVLYLLADPFGKIAHLMKNLVDRVDQIEANL